jgi:hypothetical protein
MTHEERFDRIDASLERLDARLEASVARIDANIERLTQYVLEFREETARRFELIDSRLDSLNATVSSIDLRLPGLTKFLTSARLPRNSPTIRPETEMPLRSWQPAWIASKVKFPS